MTAEEGKCSKTPPTHSVRTLERARNGAGAGQCVLWRPGLQGGRGAGAGCPSPFPLDPWALLVHSHLPAFAADTSVLTGPFRPTSWRHRPRGALQQSLCSLPDATSPPDRLHSASVGNCRSFLRSRDCPPPASPEGEPREGRRRVRVAPRHLFSVCDMSDTQKALHKRLTRAPTK